MFGKKKELPKVVNSSSLQIETTNVLQAFSKVIAELQRISKAASDKTVSNQKVIDELNSENDKLKTIRDQNAALASKFSDLINPKVNE